MLRYVDTSISACRRRGVLLAGALICLIIVLMFAAALVQALVTQRRQGRGLEQQPQSIHMADAGLRRAAFKLRQSAAYAGETWRVSAEQLGGAQAGEVIIRVTTPDSSPRVRQIHVEARFPAGAAPFVHVQEINFPLSVPGETK